MVLASCAESYAGCRSPRDRTGRHRCAHRRGHARTLARCGRRGRRPGLGRTRTAHRFGNGDVARSRYEGSNSGRVTWEARFKKGLWLKIRSLQMDLGLVDKVVLICGGSKGIGLAVAKLFAA